MDAVAGESDTTNNCSVSVQVDVSVPQTGQGGSLPAQPRPDLVVLGVFLASGVLDGSPGRSLTFRSVIRNAGDAESAATTLRFYRSASPTIAPSATEEGSVPVEALAASGGTETVSISLTPPPAAGTYYYGACVDAVAGESETSNNCTLSLTLTVDGPPPDLIVVGPYVSDYSPQPGETFRLLVTVGNRGAGGSAATTVRFYQSTDATITTSDISVGTHRITALVPSGNYGVLISLPAPATPATYYYGAWRGRGARGVRHLQQLFDLRAGDGVGDPASERSRPGRLYGSTQSFRFSRRLSRTRWREWSTRGIWPRRPRHCAITGRRT